MTETSTQTRVSKIESNYFGNTEIRSNIPSVTIEDAEWGKTPSYAVPMKAREKMTVTLTAPTVVQAISDEYNQETLFQPQISTVASYCNGEQIAQSSTLTTAIVNNADEMNNAYISKVSGGSMVTAEIGTQTKVNVSSDTRISVVINALEDCVVVFRNIGDWIGNVTLSGLSTTRLWLAKFDIIIEEYKLLVEETLTTFSLLMGAAASTYYTVMWLRYRAPAFLATIMQFIGNIYTTNWIKLENNHGPYIETQANVLPIEG